MRVTVFVSFINGFTSYYAFRWIFVMTAVEVGGGCGKDGWLGYGVVQIEYRKYSGL